MLIPTCVAATRVLCCCTSCARRSASVLGAMLARSASQAALMLQGNMPALLSHYRPDHPIYTFTEDRAVQRRLAVYHGVTAIYMPFQDTAEETFKRCGRFRNQVRAVLLCVTAHTI